MPDQPDGWTLEPGLNCPMPRNVVLNTRVFVVLQLLLFVFAIAAGAWGAIETDRILVGLTFFGVLETVGLRLEFQRRYSKALVEWGVATRGSIVDFASDEDGNQPIVGFYTNDGQFVRIETAWKPVTGEVGEPVTVVCLHRSPKRARVYE